MAEKAWTCLCELRGKQMKDVWRNGRRLRRLLRRIVELIIAGSWLLGYGFGEGIECPRASSRAKMLPRFERNSFI